MDALAELWPPYALTITSPAADGSDLTLRTVRESDLPELLALVRDGVHDPATMPFETPWTDVTDPARQAEEYLRYQSSVKASFTPESFSIQLAVRRDGVLVGTQGFEARDFAITRSGETGSWLGRRFHGQGIGTRMRRAVCAFAFDVLGARRITSSAFVDNPASLAVSRKVGYRPNGTRIKVRRGEPALNQGLLLTPEDLVRVEAVQVAGGPELCRFLRL